MPGQPKIICRDVWKVFGPSPERALATIDRDASRDRIQAETGHVVAVRDVSFEVQTGETFVVMGLSGSGKSTLVRCISRLIEPTAGEVVIDGENVIGYGEKELQHLRRTKMSMVFQHFGLLPHRTVLDNVMFGLEIRGEDRDARLRKAMETLEMVGLKGWETNYPRELSGGMQQRVGLARAMAVDPEILIFDEPFSALDPLIRRNLQDEFLGLSEKLHKTTVFITHDLDEAIRMGDRIGIMKDGEIVQIGTAEDIVTAPADEYVADFVAGISRLKLVSAAKIMVPVERHEARHGPLGEPGAHPQARPEDDLDTLVELSTGTELPVLICAEGRTVGVVTKDTLLHGLQGTTDQ